MISYKTTISNSSTQKIKDYFKKHSKGLKVSIGFFGSKNKRLEAGTGTVKSVYGLKKTLTKTKSSITNSYVAKKNIEGSTFISKQGNNIKIPARNFFVVASDKKYWGKNNFDFLRDFYKINIKEQQATNRLGNLGAVIIKRAIADSGKYAPNTDFTQELKGGGKPLIDSMQMLNSVGWKKWGN